MMQSKCSTNSGRRAGKLIPLPNIILGFLEGSKAECTSTDDELTTQHRMDPRLPDAHARGQGQPRVKISALLAAVLRRWLCSLLKVASALQSEVVLLLARMQLR